MLVCLPVCTAIEDCLRDGSHWTVGLATVTIWLCGVPFRLRIIISRGKTTQSPFFHSSFSIRHGLTVVVRTRGCSWTSAGDILLGVNRSTITGHGVVMTGSYRWGTVGV